MISDPATSKSERLNPFTAEDVASILRVRGWLREESTGFADWLECAAKLLGPQAAQGTADDAGARARLEDLLGLIFQYDARAILATPQAHEALLREGARPVLRELAHRILSGPEVDSDRFKVIIDELKEATGRRGRHIFHPLRLALAGRTGEGELDRVILLLDAAAKLPFAVAVKGTRARMLEFCSALD